MMPVNRLRRLLREGKASVGTHYSCTWANLVEIIGNSGQFDYAEFTGNMAPIRYTILRTSLAPANSQVWMR